MMSQARAGTLTIYRAKFPLMGSCEDLLIQSLSLLELPLLEVTGCLGGGGRDRTYHTGK